jgi:PKD repeat protein
VQHSIVSYDWDVDSDGVYDATGVTAGRSYGQMGSYTATLRVTDDNLPPKTGTLAVVVTMDHAPAAQCGGPYILEALSDLRLDGSASSDPDQPAGDSIVSYAWGLDSDGKYDDASDVVPTVAWAQLAGMAGNADLPVSLRVTDSLGATGAAATTLRIVVPQVVGRYVFCNNSYWDGNGAGASAADDAAVATDKQALLPGKTATFANYTSYSRGINGIMIDVADLPPGAPTPADFEFRVGNDNTPANWALAGVAPGISVRRGAGTDGSDRITLIFPDGSVTKQRLRVKVLAGGSVGLAGDDVFYFGNAIGEAGNLAADAKVTTLDVSLTRANQISFPAPPPVITNVYDFNRDHRANTMDVSLVRSNLTTVMNALKLIAPPVESPLAPEPVAAPAPATADPLRAAIAASPAPAAGPATWVSAKRTMDALAAAVALSSAPALAADAVGRPPADSGMRALDILESRLPDPLALWDLPALKGFPRRAR